MAEEAADGAAHDAVGGQWLALAGSGAVGGLAVAGALVGPLYGVLPGHHVPGWTSWPWFVGPVGYVTAALIGVAVGYVAGRASPRPVLAGTAAGALAGHFAYVLVIGATATVLACAPFWAGMGDPTDENGQVIHLASAVIVLSAAQLIACVLSLLGFAGLGALGGTIATVLRAAPVTAPEPSGYASLSGSGLIGVLVSLLASLVFGTAMQPLHVRIAEKAAHAPVVALANFAFGFGPMALFVASFGMASALLGIGLSQHARRAVRAAVYVPAIVGVGAPVLTTAFVALISFGTSTWLAGSLAAVAIAATAVWLAIRAASPADGPLPIESLRASAAGAVTDVVAGFNPFLVCVLFMGVSNAIATVPCIPYLTRTPADSPAPDVLAIVSRLYTVPATYLLPGLVGAFVLMFAARRGFAFVAARRRA